MIRPSLLPDKVLDGVKGISVRAQAKAEAGKRLAMDHIAALGRDQKVRAATVLYESFDGSGFLCNPEAIFRALAADPAFDHLEHIWVYRRGVPRSALLEGLRPSVKVRFVRYRSVEYFVWLGRAQYLVNNSSFPPEFTKKAGQTYVNTWHGVPLKVMGYDIPGGRPDTRNVVRNLLSADYVVSTGEWMTRTMYASAFRLQGLFAGRVLETGYPRIDALLAPGARERALTELSSHGVDVPDDVTTVLWCPTWRGANPYAVQDDSAQVQAKVEALQAALGPSYFVVAKLHQLTLRAIPSNAPVRARLVPNDVPVDVALAATDHLVTDYSSVFFDFLPVDRPIHFLLDDLEDYSATRGLYEEPADLPGSVSESVGQLAEAIRSGESPELRARRERWRQKYVPHEDGNSARRLIDAVFRDDLSRAVSLPQEKPKVLVHAGSLIPNGITSAALALIANLDYERFDVTVMYPFSKDEYRYERSLEIDERARILPRIGRTAMSLQDRKWYTSFTQGGGWSADGVDRSDVDRLFELEKRRCVGDSSFDLVLAFDGYQVFWSQLMLQMHADRTLIWAHNDLMQDAERTVDGKQPHKKNLHSLFTLYDQFDKIVSVTPELMKINADALSAFAPVEKFGFVRNFLRTDMITRMAAEPLAGELAGEPGHQFVTVARLSPEKNQARIIRAFAQVAERDPRAGLTIVGDGPLRHDLEALVGDLGIEDRVYFAGLRSNPFPWIKHADAFVFASLYEGQGLALLEALVLDTWVITTEFNVVHEVLEPGQGDIVPPDDDALADAMTSFLDAPKVSRIRFDADEYNGSVRAELERVISAS